ncbi:MAG: phosphoethanolamine transferase CptA [Bacteroidales bacterium]|nr:phosphoethanolamine transferase CptA [Bacteroidales bacterium]
MKNKITACLLALLPLSGWNARVFAQENVRVWADFDTVGWVGDALRLTFYCESDQPEKVNFPVLDGNIAPKLQLVPEDSLRTASSFNTASQLHTRSLTYHFSAYEEGAYAMPAFRFEYVDHDSLVYLHTDTGSVRFFSPVVDTTANIKDIHSVFDVTGGELWREYFAKYGFWLWILLGLAGMVAVAVYVLRRYRKNQPVFMPQKPALPPVEQALTAMKILKEKQLWQQNRIKEYYTELTDILRQYLASDMDIAAVEMTNEELGDALKENLPDKPVLQDLLAVLDMSVLVKFAKVQPQPADHEACFDKILRFLELQKQEKNRKNDQPEPDSK